MGECITTISNIASAVGGIFEDNFRDKKSEFVGKLIVKTYMLNDTKEVYQFKIQGINLKSVDGIFRNDPFLRFVRIRERDKSTIISYQSVVLKNNTQPNWDAFSIPAGKLNNGNHQWPFSLECWDWENDGKHNFIGYCQPSIHEISKLNKKEFELYDEKNFEKRGILRIDQFSIKIVPELIDYLHG